MKRIVILLFCALFIFSSVVYGEDKSFFFIRLADPQPEFCPATAGLGSEDGQIERIAGAINRLKPAFVVVSGDWVNDCGEAILSSVRFRKLYDRIDLKIPLYLLPGDCETVAPEAADGLAVRRAGGSFVVRKEGCCIIGLNTPVIRTGTPQQRQEQYLWLEKQLERTKKCRRRILVGYHPFFVSTPDEPDSDGNIPLQERQRYFDLCARYQVDQVLAGHSFRSSGIFYGNTRFSVTGVAGQPAGGDKPGLQIVIVHPDRIHAVFYETDLIPSCVELFRR